jgi:hypothetical protein
MAHKNTLTMKIIVKLSLLFILDLKTASTLGTLVPSYLD